MWLHAAVEVERTSAELMRHSASLLEALITVKGQLRDEFAQDLGHLARYRDEIVRAGRMPIRRSIRLAFGLTFAVGMGLGAATVALLQR